MVHRTLGQVLNVVFDLLVALRERRVFLCFYLLLTARLCVGFALLAMPLWVR